MIHARIEMPAIEPDESSLPDGAGIILSLLLALMLYAAVALAFA